MSILLQNISKSYGEQEVICDISFNMKQGEIVGLLGPNGAGKSTLMKMIVGSIKQEKGEIKVCDLNTLEKSIESKNKIGYLPENNPLYTDMYVKEYLKFISDIYNISKKKEIIDKVIKETGLNTEKHKKIEMLSKGYCQRVGLAAALIHNPEVLILDEPTTGLDPNQLLEIRNLIKTIGKNKTVLLSTHIMQEVYKICNRVIIINKGKIVDDQYIKDLKNDDLEEHFRSLTTNTTP